MVDNSVESPPTNAKVAELLNIPEAQVETYRLDTVRAGDIWRVSLAKQILSPLRLQGSSEHLPANLILEIPIQSKQEPGCSSNIRR